MALPNFKSFLCLFLAPSPHTSLPSRPLPQTCPITSHLGTGSLSPGTLPHPYSLPTASSSSVQIAPRRGFPRQATLAVPCAWPQQYSSCQLLQRGTQSLPAPLHQTTSPLRAGSVATSWVADRSLPLHTMSDRGAKGRPSKPVQVSHDPGLAPSLALPSLHHLSDG